ncbi:hypothetical protein [Chromobacterium sp. IIBBL 290-4]|uniref:hypothetical protein n=1 Tax=Chromobacterium sp. IIBBL 290-4 TaxID=2953890 RepID=UPI0020B84154|nr:hypothetical protein [Chromobacterium sp. IIBBL 290-4]UTH76278.1 hypothetical protein NKT35_09320 [Chromobacterium sp. IIBBL 290-4]
MFNNKIEQHSAAEVVELSSRELDLVEGGVDVSVKVTAGSGEKPKIEVTATWHF